jgi:hypothetical protein
MLAFYIPKGLKKLGQSDFWYENIPSGNPGEGAGCDGRGNVSKFN